MASTIYLQHFGLDEAPFTITPHTEFFFSGASRGATLDALVYAIEQGEGMVKVSGEVGSGKTMLCRMLMERLPATVETIYLAIPSLARDEILEAVASDLGLNASGESALALTRQLQARLIELHATGRQVVVLIDEAHAMPQESLEQIRLLSNLETNQHKLLQIVLFGQPELDETLALAQMRQLKERITHSFKLTPLPIADIQAYVDFRLRAAGYRGPALFNPACIKLIAKASQGLSRRINILADKSLLAAFSGNTHSVTPQHVQAAIRDCDFPALKPKPQPTWWIAAGSLAAGLFLGVAGSHIERKQSQGQDAATSRPAPVAAAKPAAPPQTAIDTSAPPAQPTPALPAAGLPERLATNRLALFNRPAEHFAIQLMLADASNPARITQHLQAIERLLGQDQLLVYPTLFHGVPHVGMLYGDFAQKSAAMAALNQLPAAMRQFSPYVRSFQVVRGEVRYASDNNRAAAP